jgi:hypothetical protein
MKKSSRREMGREDELLMMERKVALRSGEKMMYSSVMSPWVDGSQSPPRRVLILAFGKSVRIWDGWDHLTISTGLLHGL